MKLVWIEAQVKPSTHPAFERAEKRKIGTKKFLGEEINVYECTLTVPKPVPKSKFLTYLLDKKKHLKTFNVEGEIVY